MQRINSCIKTAEYSVGKQRILKAVWRPAGTFAIIENRAAKAGHSQRIDREEHVWQSEVTSTIMYDGKQNRSFEIRIPGQLHTEGEAFTAKHQTCL